MFCGAPSYRFWEPPRLRRTHWATLRSITSRALTREADGCRRITFSTSRRSRLFKSCTPPVRGTAARARDWEDVEAAARCGSLLVTSRRYRRCGSRCNAPRRARARGPAVCRCSIGPAILRRRAARKAAVAVRDLGLCGPAHRLERYRPAGLERSDRRVALLSERADRLAASERRGDLRVLGNGRIAHVRVSGDDVDRRGAAFDRAIVGPFGSLRARRARRPLLDSADDPRSFRARRAARARTGARKGAARVHARRRARHVQTGRDSSGCADVRAHDRGACCSACCSSFAAGFATEQSLHVDYADLGQRGRRRSARAAWLRPSPARSRTRASSHGHAPRTRRSRARARDRRARRRCISVARSSRR